MRVKASIVGGHNDAAYNDGSEGGGQRHLQEVLQLQRQQVREPDEEIVNKTL